MTALYDTIGAGYAATRRADPAICRTLARLVDLADDALLLDLACGTGNYTRALAALGGHWHGVDVSKRMLAQAAAGSPEITWTLAAADALPYGDGTFNGAICTLAIHHFPDLHGAFGEVFRVLDRGRFVILTAFPDQMERYWLHHYFPAMMERSARVMPTREMLAEALVDAGFELDEIVPFHVTSGLEDLFLYAGKERPELYFDPTVRANISSFALLCPEQELRSGLDALRRDLDEGRFEQIASRYASTLGDYAFVVASRRRGT